MNPRVMMLIHQFKPVASGAELQAERLGGKLVERGHDVRVLTNRHESASPADEILHGMAVHRSPRPLSYFVFSDISPEVRYLVRNREAYDILHSHQCFNHAVVATVVAKWFGKKSIFKIACAGDVGDLNTFSKFRGFGLALRILHQADASIAISREVEQELLAYGFPAERIHRIPNGVDVAVFRREHPFPDRSKVRFVLIGSRRPQKGIDVTVGALKLLARKGIDDRRLEVRSYGWDYPDYDYRAMASELGVQNMVEFLPYTDDIKDVYHGAHCLLLPSRAEGLSNVLLEAMSFELPVIATDISGSADVIDHGRNGILIPPGDAAALANAMERIINDRERAGELGRDGRRKMEEQFSLDGIARRYSELYRTLCSHEAEN